MVEMPRIINYKFSKIKKSKKRGKHLCSEHRLRRNQAQYIKKESGSGDDLSSYEKKVVAF
jgi:hypothetical protein